MSDGPASDGPPDGGPADERPPSAGPVSDGLTARIRALTREEQLFLALLYVEDLSAGDVARVLGQTEAAVDLRHARLRARLRTLLRQTEPDHRSAI